MSHAAMTTAASVIAHTPINNHSSLHHLCLCDSQANLADFGDNQWVTCFQETAEVLLGHSAETLGQLRDTVRHTDGYVLPYTTLLKLVSLHLTSENCFGNFARLLPANLLGPGFVYTLFSLFQRMKLRLMKSSKKSTSRLTSSKTESSWRRIM